MKGKNVFAVFCMFIVSIVCVSSLFAEIKVFEKEVEEIVGRGQSQEQVESFALQKAKRLAVEEAGTYISSLTVVRNFQLEKEEINALASGVVQTKVIGIPSVEIKSGFVHVKVKAVIQVDTAILDKQIAEIMKEKGTLKQLEKEQRKVKQLENQLANLKSTELKRLEELNAQALALEKEREKQRLFREEQALKAQGALKQAEIERIQKEKDMQERINKTLNEQEKARWQEAGVLAKEQDRVRKAQLENEQRWNELARKAQLTQSFWTPIDDSLSLKQAVEEVKQLKSEIANLKKQLDLQLQQNTDNLKKAFEQQVALTKPQLPPQPGTKDPFETTAEYEKRLKTYNDKVEAANRDSSNKVKKLEQERDYLLAKTKTEHLQQRISVLEPFVKRTTNLQEKKFVLPEGKDMKVALGEPEAEKNRFPLHLQYHESKWAAYWEYTDREKARDFYKTKAYLNAQGIFQVEDKGGVSFRLTGARVSHAGTKESRDLQLEQPKVFVEISEFDTFKNELAKSNKVAKRAEAIYTGKIHIDPVTGMELVFVKSGCFYMGDTFGDGSSNEKPVHNVCVPDFHMGKYEVTQGQWKAIMGSNPSYFKNCGDTCPVESVSWNDVQEFIQKLNSLTGKSYRLPTEAEWEYAARSGGKKEKYAGTSSESSLGSYAWYDKNSENHTHPVGQKQPNSLGLYDMSGNVWEWCQDWYDKYYYSSSTRDNPQGPYSSSDRVLRGGSWYYYPRDVRASFRYFYPPPNWYYFIGFRVVSSSR